MKTRRRAIWLMRMLSVAVLGLGQPLPIWSTPERPPNVLLIITDQQYGRAFGSFLPPGEISTPNMDRLAAIGMTFTRAYASNPRCMPSRSSMFSGRHPHETQVQENNGYPENAFSYPLLGRYFSDAGYDTAYFGKFHIPVSDEAQRGFKTTAHLRSTGMDRNVTKDAVRYLGSRGGQPFFLTVSFCNPHNICEYARAEPLPDGSLPPPPALADCPPPPRNPNLPRDECDTMVEQKALRAGIPDYRLLEKYTAADWQRYRWAYYRLIEKVDAQLGEILAALQAANAEKDTLIVFTSDHGECAGAHGFGEKVVFYEESVLVPFVLTWPGHVERRQNAAFVNTGIDLLPTLCDFARIPVPAGLPGRSVRPLTHGAAPADWPSHVVVENVQEAGAARIDGRMVRTAEFKYCIFNRGVRCESLFDEVNDPFETTNLAYLPQHQSHVQQARQLLREHGHRHADTVALACLDRINR